MNLDFTIKYKMMFIWDGWEHQAQEEACLSFDKKDQQITLLISCQ